MANPKSAHPRATSTFLQASDAYLQTNNQYLSLTDQMNLGVRIVELDTHFFDVSFITGQPANDELPMILCSDAAKDLFNFCSQPSGPVKLFSAWWCLTPLT